MSVGVSLAQKIVELYLDCWLEALVFGASA